MLEGRPPGCILRTFPLLRFSMWAAWQGFGKIIFAISIFAVAFEKARLAGSAFLCTRTGPHFLTGLDRIPQMIATWMELERWPGQAAAS